MGVQGDPVTQEDLYAVSVGVSRAPSDAPGREPFVVGAERLIYA